MSCIIKQLKKNLESVIETAAKNVKFIDYTYKYKKKAYDPNKIATDIEEYFTSKEDKTSPKKFEDHLYTKKSDGSIEPKVDLFSLSKMSALATSLRYMFDNKLKLKFLNTKQETEHIEETGKDDKGNEVVLQSKSIPYYFKKAIAISNILDSVPEYLNKAKKTNTELLKDINGNIKFNAKQLAYVIGREIMYKSGVIYTGPDRINRYTDLGMSLLKDLEKDGVIKITENDQVPVFNMYNEKTGEMYGKGKLKDVNSIDGTSVVFNFKLDDEGNVDESNSFGSKHLYDLLNGYDTIIKMNGKNKKIHNIYEYREFLLQQFKNNKKPLNNDLDIVNELEMSKNLLTIFTPMNKAKVYTNKADIDENTKKLIENELSTMTLFSKDGKKDSIITDLAKGMENKPYYIRKEYLAILQHVAKDWKEFIEKRIMENKPYSITAFLNDPKYSHYKTLFKIDLSEEDSFKINIFEDKDSDVGKVRTRTLALFNVLTELLDNPKLAEEGKFYKLFFRGNNARLYNAMITLNEESDKIFTRNIIQRSKEPIEIEMYDNEGKITSTFNAYITYINEHLPKALKGKLTAEIIKDLINAKTEKDKINVLDKAFGKNYINFYKLANIVHKVQQNKIDTQLLRAILTSSGSNVNITHVINSVLMLQELFYNINDNKLKTTFDIETDANSSGPTIKAFQELGSNDKAEGILNDLGLLNKSKKVKGLYEYVLDKLNNLLNPNINKDKIFTDDNVDNIEDILNQNIFGKNNFKEGLEASINMWKYLTEDLKINARNLIKSPVMTVGAYSQLAYSSAKGDTSKKIVDFLIDKIVTTKKGKEAIGEEGLDIVKHIVNTVKNTLTDEQENTLKNILGDSYEMLFNGKEVDDVELLHQLEIIKNEGKLRTMLKTLIERNVATLLANISNKYIQEDIFNKDTNNLKMVFNSLEKLFFFGSQKVPSMFNMPDLTKVYDHLKSKTTVGVSIKEAFEDVINTMVEESSTKDNLTLLSDREAINPDTGIARSVKIPNVYTLLVSTIHNLDATILARAYELLEQKIGKDVMNKFNISTIHDAYLLPYKYADAINEAYTEATYDINSLVDRSLVFYMSVKYKIDKLKNALKSKNKKIEDFLNQEQLDELNTLESNLNKLISERFKVIEERNKKLSNININKIEGNIISYDIDNNLNDKIIGEPFTKNVTDINKEEDSIKNEELDINTFKFNLLSSLENNYKSTFKKLLNQFKGTKNNRVSNFTKFKKLLNKLVDPNSTLNKEEQEIKEYVFKEMNNYVSSDPEKLNKLIEGCKL